MLPEKAYQFVLQSCFFNVLTKHTNLFGECAARCVHLSLEGEECTSSSWRDSKTYTSGSIANSRRILTEINENGTIAKISIWVESNTAKHLKAFRIISSECKFHLSYIDDIFVVCKFRSIFICFFKSLCLGYTGQLFWKIIVYE